MSPKNNNEGSFIKRYLLHTTCYEECNEKSLYWLVLNPNKGVKWEEVPEGTPVLVWEQNENESIPHARKRFFAKYMPDNLDGKFAVYANGATSWTYEGKYEKWSNCSLFLIEDMKKYMKKD